MSHPVAHEGNPRTDSITISGGDVLSTASLEVILPGPSQAPAVTAPTLTGTKLTTICPTVFAWNSDRPDPFNSWDDSCGNSDINQVFRYDSGLAMTVNPSPNCYGVLYNEMEQAPSFTNNSGTAWPIQQVFFQTAFLTLLSGAPRAGICIAVQDPTRSTANLTLLALVTDWAAGTTGLYYWAAGDIADLSLATSSQVSSYTPSAGENFRLFFRQTDTGIFGNAFIYTNGFTDIAWQAPNTIDLTASIDNPLNYGYIAVGGGQQGSVLFGGVPGATCIQQSSLASATNILSQRNNFD